MDDVNVIVSEEVEILVQTVPTGTTSEVLVIPPTAPLREVALPISVTPSVIVIHTSTTSPGPTILSTIATVPIALASSGSGGPSSFASNLTTPAAKRGLAYNDISLLEDFLGTGSQSSWCYNWASRPDGTVPAGLEFVPMLWGLNSSMTSDWEAAVSSALASGSRHLLSFNEPDLGPPNPQSDLSFEQAAKGYYQYMEKYSGQARLGSPGVTNGDPTLGMGLGWLDSFIQACENLGCTIDFVSIHWYDSAANIAYFKDHVTQAYATGGHRAVWITEFSASGSAAEQQTFLQTVIPWLDAQEFVERYAYFMVTDGSLVSGTSISPLGRTYAFLPW